MKKILIILLVVLVSCSNTKTTTKPQSDTSKFTKKEISIDNKSTYKLKEKVNIMYDSEYIPYISIKEFTEIFQETNQFEFKETEDLVTITVKVKLEEKEKYILDGKEITESTANFIYNKKDNTITHSGNFGDSFIKYNGEFDIDLIIKDMSISNEIKNDKDFVVDLDDYKINVLNEKETYMPFYLLMHYFSNSDIALYYSGQSIQAFNYSELQKDANKMSEIKSKITLDSKINKGVQEESDKFLSLLYNEYYAFSESRIHVDVLKNLEKNKLSSTNSKDKNTDMYREFIGSLEDGHSSVIMDGYFDDKPSDDTFASYSSSKFIQKYIEVLYSKDCINDKNNASDTKVVDGVGYINFTSFSDDSGDFIGEQLEKLGDVDKVAIDLRCNGGGLLYTVPQVLKYFTNEDMKMNTTTLNKNDVITNFNPGNDYKTKHKFYVLTDFSTYSAANYMSSLIKDNGYATLIGQKSGGGGAAVRNVISPDGTIFSYADGFSILLDKNKKEIETGVEPDIVSKAKTVDELIKEIKQDQ